MVKVLSASAFILAAAALALAALRPSPAPSPVEHASARADARGAQDREELELRLRGLEDTLAHLSRRLTEMEQAARRGEGAVPSGGVAAGAMAQVDVADELRQLRADLRQVAAAEALHTERGRVLLKEAVRSVQDELQADRVREFRDQQETAREERFRRLVDEARLTGTQERELRGLFDAESALRAQLIERMRSGERGQMFRELRTLREQHDQQARKLLAEDQYEKFTELRQDERRNWGGRGPP
jgi:hypothetical protein